MWAHCTPHSILTVSCPTFTVFPCRYEATAFVRYAKILLWANCSIIALHCAVLKAFFTSSVTSAHSFLFVWDIRLGRYPWQVSLKSAQTVDMTLAPEIAAPMWAITAKHLFLPSTSRFYFPSIKPTTGANSSFTKGYFARYINSSIVGVGGSSTNDSWAIFS